MSDTIGPIALLLSDAQNVFLPGVSETSERTQQRLDEEVERIIEAAQAEVTELVAQQRDKLRRTRTGAPRKRNARRG